ncbi:MAG TPA: nucleoside-diphosphate sugar epimerase/dehydratase, partial [Candidatus Saccharimonadales bacterium]|nr:nucleoside-diphosphate sugar epimerase/dehydratase [Candidatus Saccharimonadales bacterium]
ARFNLFHGYWRYTGISDALDITKAVALGSVGFVIVERFVIGEKSFPISIYFLEAILTASALGAVRVLSRAILQAARNHARSGENKTVIVIGAGCAGAMLLRELPRSGYTAVAMVDDDPGKTGVRLHGVPIVGKVEDLLSISQTYSPDELMIAIPSATRGQMRHITEFCRQTGLRFRTIPGLADLIHGTVTPDQLREVNLEDLLGRAPVDFKLDSVRRSVAGKVVMVTGAAGSIGSELFHQLLRYSPAKLIAIDQAETPLFYLQQANLHDKMKTEYCIADITDTDRMRELIVRHDVSAIFHAAAYKHVPLVEDNLQEAVKNNVFGLLSLMEVADRCGCEDFLLISSDKAVNPTSFMGCTKRIGELIIAAHPFTKMRCLSVRFGNVLGSQGSVIPVFQEQIRSQRQITVTHPDITRYFMTIPEAVSLVLQAFTIGSKGDILVLDMGEPIRILDMAKMLIGLSGIPGDDVKIKFTGLRPGEKLFEELFYASEQQFSTPAEKVFRTRGNVTSWADLDMKLKSLEAEIATDVSSRIRSKVKEIVPEYEWVQTEDAFPVALKPGPQSCEIVQRLQSATD